MSPHYYYVRYLVTAGLDDEEIREHLAEMGFSVEDATLSSVRSTLMIPKAFVDLAQGKGTKDHRLIIKYARRFNIKEMWTFRLNGKPREIRDMIQLARDRENRLIPVVLALKKDPEYDTALKRLGREYEPKAVRLMMHYFFNTKIVSMAGWREFFARFSPEALNALDQPLDYIKHRLGLTPDVSFVSILEDLMYMSYYQSREHMRGSATRDSAAIAKSMADLAIKAGEKLKKYGAGDTRTFLDDVRISFEKANMPIPSIEEVDPDSIPTHQELFDPDGD